ncbi:MAG: gliding motility-associated protein GldE [Chitinophagaceae bacterium]|nr:gliding motility-associated protein GldE [Chitinophagaceae bacterium]
MDHFPFHFLQDIPSVLLAVNTQGATFMLISLVLLLFLAFTISGAEVALFSLSRKDLNMLKTKQHVAAKRIVKLLEEPKELFASLLIAGTIVSICIIILANYLIIDFISFGSLPFFMVLLIKVVFITFVLVFFGKILPKMWATQQNLRFAYNFVFLIEGIHLLMRKISKWVVSLADRIGKTAGANRSEATNIRELDEAIDVKSDEEASPAEKNIMKGIVKFGNITVRQVMRNRVDVSGVDHETHFGELIRYAEEQHYSRLPVYRGSMDDIAGIIVTKDLLPHLQEPDDYDWHPLMRRPFFVPETKLIEDLLREFQQKKVHFAVVVDEFGGTSGIVTMEDILEEVIGDIRDEFDDEENTNRKLDDHNYIFDGRTMIHEICKTLSVPADTFDSIRGGSESLAGMVLELAGEFPAVNSVVSSGDFDFTVLAADRNRIQLIKLTLKPRS